MEGSPYQRAKNRPRPTAQAKERGGEALAWGRVSFPSELLCTEMTPVSEVWFNKEPEGWVMQP